jgi:FdhD protein
MSPVDKLTRASDCRQRSGWETTRTQEPSDVSDAMPGPTQLVPRQAWRNGTVRVGERLLPEEVAVAFSYDGTTHAVLVATPDDLEDFALGFSYTEGIIGAPADLEPPLPVSVPDGVILQMWLTKGRSEGFAARRRRHVGPTGCGMCGLESLAEANRANPPVISNLQVTRNDIEVAVAALPHRQSLNRETRAVHAAAFWEPDRDLLVREDIGRHNALDKLAGALLRHGRSAANGIIVLSSRISIELVQKAAVIGAPIVVAVSAPTALAVRAANAAAITLIGIARDDGFEVFTHPERIRNAPLNHVRCL